MSPSFGQITFDCTNAAALAGFWSQLLDHPVDEEATEFFATVGLRSPGQAPPLMFIKVPEAKETKNRVHIDLRSADWRDDAKRAVELGATHVAEYAEFGVEWASLLDPEGNEFDIGGGISN
jgi:predicted enzyme related to lactoylglutathione lyase